MTDELDATANGVLAQLRSVSRQDKADFLPRFFQAFPGGYGEGDQFLGCVVPDQRKVARKFRGLSRSELTRLLASPWHECRLTGMLILVLQYEQAAKPKNQNRLDECREIVEFYLSSLSAANNWDIVDTSAPRILGAWLLEYPEDRDKLDPLAASEVVWERRVAVSAGPSRLSARRRKRSGAPARVGWRGRTPMVSPAPKPPRPSQGASVAPRRVARPVARPARGARHGPSRSTRFAEPRGFGAVVLSNSAAPVLVAHAVGEEVHERLLAVLLDQVRAERVPLGVERQDIARVLLHREHPAERDAALGPQEVDQHSFLLGDLAAVLDRCARALVRPAGQGLAEVAGENGVRHLVRQHRVEDALAAALDLHLPAEHLAAVENERGRPARAESRRDLGGQAARLTPLGHRATDPLDREVVAPLFGRLADLTGELRRRRFDDEVLRPVAPGRCIDTGCSGGAASASAPSKPANNAAAATRVLTNRCARAQRSEVD